INDYIKEVMGERFSAKDFRTWAGTLIAACALARLKTEEVEGRTDRRKMVVAAVKETAAQLGNTPAVCKASYIWPSVLRSFEIGSGQTTEGLPVAPSLGPALLEARVPPERALVDARVVFICALSIVIAAAAGVVAQALTRLIGFVTNLAFYGRVSSVFVSPAA